MFTLFLRSNLIFCQQAHYVWMVALFAVGDVSAFFDCLCLFFESQLVLDPILYGFNILLWVLCVVPLFSSVQCSLRCLCKFKGQFYPLI